MPQPKHNLNTGQPDIGLGRIIALYQHHHYGVDDWKEVQIEVSFFFFGGGGGGPDGGCKKIGGNLFCIPIPC